MIIKNGYVFDARGDFFKGNITIKDGRLVNITSGSNNSLSGDDVIDAEGMYVIPGLIDIHLHGCVGHDFCEGTKESIDAIVEYELKNGITSICPTSMTYDEKTLTKIFATAADYRSNKGTNLLGINMEGPFISEKKAGAQNMKFIHVPDVEMFDRLQKTANGLIKLVNIAPEEPGAIDFINEVSDSVHVSIAHTMADYDTCLLAFNKGADHVTHLYNAMLPFNHRKPGVIGAACDNEKVFVELIADGVHVDPAVVRTTFKMFGDDRIILISDSMEACGLSDGEYMLGGQKVYVNGKRAVLSDGTIAGSVTNLMDCVRILVTEMRVPLATAVKCATVNPSKSVGLFEDLGSIDLNKKADLVILNRNMDIKYIIKNGEVIRYDSRN